MTNCMRADENRRPWGTRLLSAMMLVPILLVLALGSAWARQPLAAIVVDARTGKVLYARAADAPRYPASITKVMTLYLLFREMKAGRISPMTRIPISRRAASMQPSKLWLKPGQTITVDQAIRALVVKSANDVAVAVAEKLAGSEQAFARRMTRMARALGMTRTTFRNASGLPYPPNVSTARDLATLSLRLMRDFPQYYRKYFGLRYFAWRGRRHRNHNRLLGRVAGMDGIKTGYTRAAGSNLAASVRRGGKRIVAVVLGARSSRARNAYMRRLIETAFRRYRLTSGSRIAALAGTPPGYSAARAKALLAKLNGEQGAQRRKASPVGNTSKRTPPRPPARPEVKVAHLAPATHPDRQAQALARLAEGADTARADVGKQHEKPAQQPVALGHRTDVANASSTSTRSKNGAGDASAPRRLQPHTTVTAPTVPLPKRQQNIYPDMLATSVMVRVLEEEAQEDYGDDDAIDLATNRDAPGAPRQAAPTTAAARRAVNHASAAGETTNLVTGVRVAVATASATPATELHPQPQDPIDPNSVVITKTSAPPPAKMHIERQRQEGLANSHVTKTNDATPRRLIADDPQRVRQLLKDHWLIQIVATPDLDAAQRLLHKARQASPQVRGRPPFVIRFHRNGKTLYRARFAGFPSRKQARRACHALQRRGFSCMVLKPTAE